MLKSVQSMRPIHLVYKISKFLNLPQLFRNKLSSNNKFNHNNKLLETKLPLYLNKSRRLRLRLIKLQKIKLVISKLENLLLE